MIDSGRRVFRTLEEASSALGVSSGAVSSGIIDRGRIGDVPARWAYRVYALRLVSGEWVLGMLNARGNAYLVVGSERVVRPAAVLERRDVTGSWYFAKEEE